MSQHQWYYRTDCTQDADQVGPIIERDFLRKIEAGNISPELFVMSPTRSKNVWYRMKQVPALMKVWDRGVAQREIVEAEPVLEVFEAELVEPTMEQALRQITTKASPTQAFPTPLTLHLKTELTLHVGAVSPVAERGPP